MTTVPPVDAILITGQSLAEGGVGGDEVPELASLTLGEQVLMFAPRPVGLDKRKVSAELVPLRESGRISAAQGVALGLARRGWLNATGARLVISGHAWGGKPYAELRRGGATGVFELLCEQVDRVVSAFPQVRYRAVLCMHGEQDGIEGNRDYAAALLEWSEDFDQAIRVRTGQAEPVPFLICQTNSASGYGLARDWQGDDFPTPLAQLAAHEQSRNVHLIGPKYPLRYYDHAHLTNRSTLRLGEAHAIALHRLRTQGDWSPLRPQRIAGDGRCVRIVFTGVRQGLVFDTQLVAPAPQMGFAYADRNGRRIVGVAITGPDEVALELNGEPGADAVVAYAFHNGTAGRAAQSSGLGDRGNLRDGHSHPSAFGLAPLHDWCVAFRKSVPWDLRNQPFPEPI